MTTKKEIKKRPPKTIKEKKFVKAYLNTGNATEAVIAAGYNVKDRMVARNIGSENLAKLGIDVYLDKAGLTNEVLAQNTTRIALTAKKRDQYTGEIDDDNAMQLKAMEFAAKLKNLMKDKDEGGTVNNYFQWVESQKNEFGI